MADALVVLGWGVRRDWAGCGGRRPFSLRATIAAPGGLGRRKAVGGRFPKRAVGQRPGPERAPGAKLAGARRLKGRSLQTQRYAASAKVAIVSRPCCRIAQTLRLSIVPLSGSPKLGTLARAILMSSKLSAAAMVMCGR